MAVAVVVGFKDGKISHEHIHWDQVGVLVQIGLVDGSCGRDVLTARPKFAANV